jgi:putative phosphonate metabolism protein
VKSFRRYAIYYLPEPGALAAFGASWLGWDVALGRSCGRPDLSGFDVAAITEAPRKYGLHATIKPPFRMASGTSPAALRADFSSLCTRLSPVDLGRLRLEALGRFLALVPVADLPDLQALAAQVVQQLDPFRAPATQAELERRQMSNLSPEKQALLQRWGYPHVMQHYRFHMTLTAKLPKPEALALLPVLRAQMAPLLANKISLKSLCLMGQDDADMFHLIERVALTG